MSKEHNVMYSIMLISLLVSDNADNFSANTCECLFIEGLYMCNVLK